MNDVSILNVLSGVFVLVSGGVQTVCFVESRFSRRKTLLLCLLFFIPLSVLDLAFYIHYGSERGGQFSLFINTLPGLFFFWFLSRHRDGRVIFAFFFSHILVGEIVLLTNIPNAYLTPESCLVNFLGRFILYSVLGFVSFRYIRKPFFRVLQGVERGWGAFAFLLAMYYITAVLMFNFPTTITSRPEELPAMLFFLALMPLTYYLLFSALLRELKLSEIREQEQLLALQTEALRRRIEQTEYTEKQLSIQRHDLRHRFHTLHTMLERGETDEALYYVDASAEVLSETKPRRWCENIVLDAMFASYFATAEAEGIRIEASLDVPKDLRVPAAELSTVFANALENAIQAVRRLPQERRVIRCKCIRHPQFMFSVSNPYEDEIRFDDAGRPIASENAGKNGHGLGTASIAAYCEKYGAFCAYEAMDGWFTLRVMQPQKEII